MPTQPGQGQAEEEGMPFINPYAQQQQAAPIENSLRYQLDPDELINKIRYILLGYKKTRDPQTYETIWVQDKERKQLINENGMNTLEPVLRGYLDKLFPLSDLDQQQIEQMTLGLEYDLRNLFTLNFLRGNSWEIPNLTTASTIKNLICNQVYATLRKAYLRGYQTFLKTIQRVQEVQSIKGGLDQYNQPQERQPKRGMQRLPLVGGFFK